MAKDDIVQRAKKFFQKCVENEKEQRIEELDDIRFVGLLEQWPVNIKAIREADPQGARPCLVVDKVNQYKNQIVNSMRQNRPTIRARPVDDTGDQEIADVYQGIIRHIEDSSKADIAYDWAGEGSVVSGLGYFRILTEYVGDSFQQEIRVARIRNRFSVYFDPNSKEPDGSDALECLITEKIPREQFKGLFPDADECPWDGATGDGDWNNEDTLRIAEYFYIEKTKEKLLLLDDGNSIFESDYADKYGDQTETDEDTLAEQSAELYAQQQQPAPKVIKSRTGERITVKWCKVSPAEVLDETIIPGNFIPVIPVIGIETDIDGKRYLRGVVRGVKDAQRMYNYNRSIIAESLNLTVKAPFIGAVGQFKTMDKEWAAANRVNYSRLEYDPVTVAGTMAPPPQRQGFAGVPVGLMQDIQTSEHDIQSALGMYEASIGQDGNAKSGRAMNAQQKQGDMATFQFPDNQSKSIRHAGRIIIGMIPIVYDTAQVVRILGEDGTPDYAHVDPEQQQAVQQQRDQTGAIKKIYNLGVGKYDVTVTTGPGYATKRMEGADFLTQLVQSSPNLMPIIGDLLFKSMDMPYSEEISDRMKLMMPQQLQKQDDGSNPEVQQIKQQSSQVIQQLQQQLDAAHQAMAQAEQEAKQLEANANTAQADIALKANEQHSKAEADQAKLALDAKRLEIEEYKAQTDRIKVEIDAVVATAPFPGERLQMMEDAVAQLINNIPEPEEEEESVDVPADQPVQPVMLKKPLIKRAKKPIDPMAAHLKMAEAVGKLAENIGRPKTIVRDENGKAIGIE